MSDLQTLRTAVIGTGHLGSIHARIHAGMPGADLRFVVDSREARAQEIASAHGGTAATDFRAILGEVDAVSIATPTAAHHEVAKACLEAGVHVLVEKPITTTVAQAEELVALAKQHNRVLAVGHSERFNPALRGVFDEVRDARFIEIHRLAPFKFRSIDIGVVLDLMIHDLDIVLATTGADPVEVRAAGVNIMTEQHEDIVNARVLFSNGCVANMTASRMSEKAMRRVRFYTPSRYVTCDMMTRETKVFEKGAAFEGFDVNAIDPTTIGDPAAFVFGKLVEIRDVPPTKDEPLGAEIADFLAAARGDKPAPTVPGEHGLRALRLAYDILTEVDKTRALQDAGGAAAPIA